jgi:uncharacterized coiled-coil protein SlyX
MDEVIFAGTAAIVVFLVTLYVSVKRSSSTPTYETREAQLSKRISDLEEHIKKQDVVIEKLQAMLYEKQAKVEELTERVRQLEQAGTGRLVGSKRKPNLVLAIGTDKALRIDVAKLRGIRNLRLSVIDNASKSDLRSLLDERRSSGSPVRLLNLSAHSGPDGVLFSDGLADYEWLSENLKDIEVLVLAGCKAHRVASLLTVVPFVVSMRDLIEHNDASTFCYHFWFAIGEGQEAENAFHYALEKSRDVVSEMAEFHSFI